MNLKTVDNSLVFIIIEQSENILFAILAIQ